MLGGVVHSKEYDGWHVTWESFEGYRFWCKQAHPSNQKLVLVVMLNPGSLSENGDNLSRDTTLRILRELFHGTQYNPYVVNLFNLATPKPQKLFERWQDRDHSEFSFLPLPNDHFAAVMYAYGNYENWGRFSEDIKGRIKEIRDILFDVPEILVPTNKTGTPKHPISIQRQRLKEVFRQAIINHSSRIGDDN